MACGEEAKTQLESLIAGQTVHYQGAEDQHGHLVATCSANGMNVNATLVEYGWEQPTEHIATITSRRSTASGALRLASREWARNMDPSGIAKITTITLDQLAQWFATGES